METFSTGACISYGWETFKKRPWFLIGAMLLVGVVFVCLVLVLSVASAALAGGGQGSKVLLDIVIFPFELLLFFGILRFSIRAHDDIHSAKLSDLWNFKSFWYFLGASLLVEVLVLAGLILLIIPGIILSLMFMFSQYVVIDKNLPPIAAMKESSRITRGNRWNLFWFSFLIALFAYAGFIVLFVGSLITIPVALLAFAHAYRLLSGTAPSPHPEVVAAATIS